MFTPQVNPDSLAPRQPFDPEKDKSVVYYNPAFKAGELYQAPTFLRLFSWLFPERKVRCMLFDGSRDVLHNGLRHPLVLDNRGTDDHPVHIHRHSFEAGLNP
jgi:hypothetical protein